MHTKKHNEIEVYTDGACKSNPGRGGWAFLIQTWEDTDTIMYGSVENTTNNRMEMIAIINSLSYIKTNYGVDNTITIYTDSKYIEGTINTRLLDKWIDNSFKGKKNVDLWVRLYGLLCCLDVKIEWVRGHNGNTYNELVDYYASKVCDTFTNIGSAIVRSTDTEKLVEK